MEVLKFLIYKLSTVFNFGSLKKDLFYFDLYDWKLFTRYLSTLYVLRSGVTTIWQFKRRKLEEKGPQYSWEAENYLNMNNTNRGSTKSS